MNLSLLREWLSWLNSSEASTPSSSVVGEGEGAIDPYNPEKRLCERDYVIIDMLNSQGHDNVSFCVTDPNLDDNPVIYISEGFSKLTGYDFDDIVGKNCRFLQGPGTEKSDVERIADAIKKEKDVSVNLVNYKKDGTKFINEFFLTTLRTPDKGVAYYIGIQVALPQGSSRVGQMPSNPGWVYTLGSHV